MSTTHPTQPFRSTHEMLGAMDEIARVDADKGTIAILDGVFEAFMGLPSSVAATTRTGANWSSRSM